MVFESMGLDNSHIIEADFFSKDIFTKIPRLFDIVVSHGFIEHFEDPSPVLARHVYLLRPGGLLVVTIPNLRWFNYLRTRMAFPEKLAMHNLAIMKRSAFKTLFDNPELHLDALYVGWIGTLSLRHVFPTWLPDVDSIVGKLIWLILRDHAIKTPFFSPDLMYIGRRRAG